MAKEIWVFSKEKSAVAIIKSANGTAYIEVWPYDWSALRVIRGGPLYAAYETASRGAKASAQRELAKWEK